MGTDDITDDNITEEDQTASVRDDIDSSFTELDDVVDDEATNDVTEDVTEETAETDSDEEESPDDSEEPAEETAELSAPEHWDESHKENFNGWPPEVKEQYMERHKEMEGRMTQGLQEVAEIKNDFGDFYTQFAPMKANLPPDVSPSQYLTNLTNADIMLSQDPMGGIQKIAQMYGIDLGQAEQTEVDPQIASLRQELNTLTQNITQRDQSAATERQNTAVQNIQDFAEAKDADGKSSHPYFDEVVNDLVTLAYAERQQGREPDLNKLYETAIWANPQVRDKMLSSQRKAEETKRAADSRDKANKAKKASKSVRGSTASAPTTGLSVREEIDRAATG